MKNPEDYILLNSKFDHFQLDGEKICERVFQDISIDDGEFKDNFRNNFKLMTKINSSA